MKDSTPKTNTQTPSAAPPEKKAKEQETISPELKKSQEELATVQEKYLRLYSEFENFKKRATKEKLILLETAGEALLSKLLPIVDDLERALEAMQATETTTQATQEGIQAIYNKLSHLLQQSGVSPMNLTKGTPFDTELHEAVTQLSTEDPTKKGTVIEIIEKGYLLKEKVLRFAKVVTGA